MAKKAKKDLAAEQKKVDTVLDLIRALFVTEIQWRQDRGLPPVKMRYEFNNRRPHFRNYTVEFISGSVRRGQIVSQISHYIGQHVTKLIPHLDKKLIPKMISLKTEECTEELKNRATYFLKEELGITDGLKEYSVSYTIEKRVIPPRRVSIIAPSAEVAEAKAYKQLHYLWSLRPSNEDKEFVFRIHLVDPIRELK
jgi:hypothetical protein